MRQRAARPTPSDGAQTATGAQVAAGLPCKPQQPGRAARTAGRLAALFACAALCLATVGCGGSSGGGIGSGNGGSGDGTTEGPAYQLPESVAVASFNASSAVGGNGALIDLSSLDQGCVSASATNQSRLKFQVVNGSMSYNYDLPGDGTPITCPLNMGNGTYTFRVMQNTSGSNYVEIASASATVTSGTDLEPFLRPNVYCNYTQDSACVALARELAADAQNQGDVLRAVYTWISQNITYDESKAASLANATGYVPDPDATLSEGSGICFDYVSLGAAMLRSLGIPCKIITGYVSPDGIYHAWNMVYLDGSWISAHVSVQAGTWSRIDLTFAAAGGSTSYAGDGTTYTERYTY